MSASDREKVVKMIQSCLVLEKKCMSSFELMRQFKDQVGMPIPYAKLGYGTLNELLKTIPGVRYAGPCPNGGGVLLAYDASHSAIGHIQDLVMRQKSQPKKTARFSVGRPLMHTRFNSSNYRGASYQTPSSRFSMNRASWDMPKPAVRTWENQPSSSSATSHGIFANKVAPKPAYIPVKKEEMKVEEFQSKKMEMTKPLGAVNQFNKQLQQNIQLKDNVQLITAKTQNLELNTPSFQPYSQMNTQFGKENINLETKFKSNIMHGNGDVVDHSSSYQNTVSKQHLETKVNDAKMSSKDGAAAVKKEVKVIRTENPMFKNYQLVGDDFLLYFAYRNLQGKMMKDPESIWCGFCYSGATTAKALDIVRQNKSSLRHKVIVMLGHMDILEENYDFEKSKHYIQLILETLAAQCTSIILLTLPYLDSNPERVRKTDNWNQWLHTIELPCVKILDLAKACFSRLTFNAVYKKQRHYPKDKKASIGMWSHLTRKFVHGHLEQSISYI